MSGVWWRRLGALSARRRPRLVGLVALVTSVLVAPVGQTIEGQPPPAPGDSPDFFGAALAIYFLTGFVAGSVAPNWSGWYAMIWGALAGGFVYEFVVLNVPVRIGGFVPLGGPLAPLLVGVMAAWAAIVVGSVGFGAALALRAWRDTDRVP